MRRLAIIVLSAVLSACSLAGPAATPAVEPATSISIPPSQIPAPPSVWIQNGIPESVASPVLSALTQAGYVHVEDAGAANIRVVIDPGPDAITTTEALYALVTPFPSVVDGVTWQEFVAYWRGTTALLVGFDAPPRMLIASELEPVLIAALGQPDAAVEFSPNPAQRASPLVDTAWNSRPSLSIVPFDQLEPRWKVLSIDGQSPLDKRLDVSAYPLVIHFGVVADDQDRATAQELLWGVWQPTNRDVSKMTVIILTGTTALTRSTAYFIESNGVDFPSLNILPFFADKDILHVSNEVSFTPKCPAPDPNATQFCSKPAYLDVLSLMDVDIVELTGNHNNDFGINPTLYSLDLYDQAGLAYYGGGRTLDEARTPRILSAPDGTRIAFVGCNSAGPFKAFASGETPGAAPCDDWEWIKQTIADLKASGQANVVIATVQYHESQSYTPEPKQIPDFQALAEAGADIVSGSQAHVPQSFAFTPNSFVHYGVGNLFFDQMDFIENRQMFADKYTFYQGRLISITLFTGIMEDYSQPRPMTAQERADFLKAIFQASGW